MYHQLFEDEDCLSDDDGDEDWPEWEVHEIKLEKPIDLIFSISSIMPGIVLKAFFLKRRGILYDLVLVQIIGRCLYSGWSDAYE